MQRAYDLRAVVYDPQGTLDRPLPETPLQRRIARNEALRNERLARAAKAVAQ